MYEIQKREKELEEKERTFSQRVDAAVKRREQAAEKRDKIWVELYGKDSCNPYSVK